MAVEPLSKLIVRAEGQQLIHGIKISRNSLPITHMFYVDDILLFSRAIVNEFNQPMQILQLYGAISGQIPRIFF